MKSIYTFKTVAILLIIFFILGNKVVAQNDTIYFMKSGYIVNKQSVKKSDVDSIKFYSIDTLVFIKNNQIIKKQSIKTTDVDSAIFYKPSIPTVTDYDGNVYKTVMIGNQIWMSENLKTTHYTDGTSIPLEPNNDDWNLLLSSNKAYCWYNNDISNKAIHGALYTWSAAMNGTISSNSNPSGVQGACPSGWHLPSEEEWIQLIVFLTENGYSYDGIRYYFSSNNIVAKSLASTTGWNSSISVGSVGNTDYPECRNKTGFSAFPSGFRNDNGLFKLNGNNTAWWCSYDGGLPNEATFYYITYDSNGILGGAFFYKSYGLSVRCVKD